MSKLIVFVSLAVMASGARLDHLVQGGYNGGGNSAPFRFENVNNGDGTYRFSYDTPTGISAHESGAPRASGPEGPAVTAEGGFSYRAPDGQQISLSYTADENGFHPTGSHLPTPPPIPEAILRSIEFNRQHPSNEGSYNGRRSGYY
ncbi:pupal cuticle protein 20-like [Melitaea cinxia]|uniref:pupal cuticle protein 20-like n=1 Tax=Melitaea cinxia TaxID=113334 RepID=UPI001E270995|nr:pupal cuticle protein 20-like [Melitaea cinxia]